MQAFSTFKLITARSNGEVIDSVTYQGDHYGLEEMETDIRHFRGSWEPGESYSVYVNGVQLDTFTNN